MHYLIALIALLIAACDSQPDFRVVETPFEPDSGTVAVRCGMLIDGLSDQAAIDQLVLVRDGRFERILAGSSDAPPSSPLLDLSEYTCLPGLIDTHTHIALYADDSADMTVYYRRSIDESSRIARENAKKTLLAGFTTVRNVGDYFPESVATVRNEARNGKAISPRISTAGPYMTIPGGGGDLVIPGIDESTIPPHLRQGVGRGPAAFRANAQRAIDSGADVLKVIASGAVFAFDGVPGAPEMTQDEIAAVVEVAHAAGLRVTAHAHGAQSIKDAILAGVDSIEHASLADDEAVALAAARGVAFSMDVYNGTYTEEVGRELGYPDEFMRKNFETTEAQRIVFEKAYAAGVPLLFGTDAGVLPHGMNARQFEIMVQRGMSPMDAIKAATSVAADHMDRSDQVGAIEKGRFGDLIAVRGNPLEDVSVLQDVQVVVKGGLAFKLATSP
jgi:imidazolonepropionase-like amidohydrolase